MSFIVSLIASVILLQNVHGTDQQLFCFYNSKSSEREGVAKFSLTDLEISLQFCTHVVYGYVGINSETFEVRSNNELLDVRRRNLALFTALKEKSPHVKFLLSIGGDEDDTDSETYIQLLEADKEKQNKFVRSAYEMVRYHNFDGLDLALRLPRNKPRKVHSEAGFAWKGFKKMFTGDYIVDKNSEQHKNQLTDLVGTLKNVLQSQDFMLTLTVLSNVNSSWYFDVPAIIGNLDFINVAAFDFLTPTRNPEEADYTAPLYPLHDQNRLPHYNVDFQVNYWLLQRAPANKINLGITTYGRAWKMTANSGTSGMPIVPKTKGAIAAELQSKIEGVMSWREVCALLPNERNLKSQGSETLLRRISDPTKRYGTYGFRPADENGENGMWVSYEDPDTAATKAIYAKSKRIGVALFDLSLDDFNGQCTGDKFPILRAIKYRLL